MKKFLAMLLAVVMVLSLAACQEQGTGNTTGSTGTTEGTAGTTATDPSNTDPSTPDVEDLGYGVDYKNNTVNAGTVNTVLNPNTSGGEVTYDDVYTGNGNKDYTDENYYTMNDYVAATSNLKWSTHTWETNEDSYILDYTSTGFYNFVLNSSKTGWTVVGEMAVGAPVDVTADYVGQFGVAEGETAKAWKITLNPNAKWDNGEVINADTYIYSYKELLNNKMMNRRADSLYAGDFVIVGAKDYLFQGKTVQVLNTTDGETMTYAWADLVKGDDGVYTTADGTPVYFALSDANPWMGGNSLAAYADAGYIPEDIWTGLTALADEDGYVVITDEAIDLLFQFTSSDTWGNETEDMLGYYVAYDYTYGDYSWDNVGILKTGEYELVLITVAPTADPSYYVPYQLSGTYLVYEPLWESCKTYFNSNGDEVDADSDDIASITTNYCTSLDTSISYGPYKLTYFELDKQFTLERNENWHGYSDGKHVGQYQTDKIDVQVIPNHETALLAFQNGEIDGISLQAEDMATYGSSEYIRYTPQSYTTKLSFNTDVEALSARGTAVLANANFRKAFSLAIDRTTFASSYTSAGSAGYGLLNYMYVYDPFTGATYRDTEGAMNALVQLYGLTYGEDGEYGDLEEAYDAITGYDMEAAKSLMAQAAEECVAAGYWDGSSDIKIQLSVYQNEDIYIKMFNYLNDALKAACVGTAFDGKVSLEMVVDADYYTTMESGNTDIIFSTWGGAAYLPYTMLYQCYCDLGVADAPNQMEYGFDSSKIMVNMMIDGLEYTQSLQTWARWANGDPDVTIKSNDGTVTLAAFGDYDAETKASLYSNMEYAYLSQFIVTPMYYRNSASLVSQKGDYAVQQYIDLIGFAGVQFYTYNYTDAEWETVKGDLTY